DPGFYGTGGTMRHDALCYVERQADHDLYAALTRGEFCYVLHARQMGKSSLMARTAARLREEGFHVAHTELTALGHNLSAEQWYGGLLEILGVALGLEDELDRFWSENQKLGPLQRFMAAIEQVVLPALTPGPSPNPGRGEIELHAPVEALLPPGLGGRGGGLGRRGQLIVFLDEIDTVRSLPFSTDEFFA